MKRVSITAIVVMAAGLLAAPVLSPIGAQASPVKPVVHTRSISGVDAASLALSPQAFDPQALGSAGANGPAQAGRAARTKVPAVLTGELDTGHFAAAGVTWSRAGAPKDVVVQVRVREAGAWSDWYDLEKEGGPDVASHEGARSAARASAGPIAAAHGEAIQVRMDTGSGATPQDLLLVTVDPGTSPADANLSGAPSSTAHAGTLAPTIVTRAQWGADETLRPADCTVDYSSTIKAGIVHHTVNTNTYAPSESAGLVRAIYAFHVNGNGWCDIGYNFLVDRFGVIFEGRFGGMDRPVIGAHAGGFNTYTFGVSGIGDFTSASPTAAMTDSISTVLGWKLGLHNRNPQGSTVLISGGGPYTNYPAGTAVPIRVVSGHRDVDATGCPGDGMYAQLNNIAYAAAVYLLRNHVTDEDLYGALSSGTGSGKVEVHGQSLSSNYMSRLIDAATHLSQDNPTQWRFFVGSLSGDSRPDLIAVQTTGTPSGKVELHVVSWASYYRDTIVNTVTPMSAFIPDSQWQLSVGGPGGGDLYLVGLSGTGSGKVEVHALSAASNYSQWSLHSTTALAQGFSASSSRFIVAKYSGDLYLLLHGSTGSGRTEVHTLTAASGYQSFNFHAVTPIGRTDDRTASWALGTDSVPNILFLPLTGTGSGH
ncbi:peptidoglycan recognition protein, partial [Lapillicoccus sp.]|uniref:peptidoglycan recognition protein family protein n=1 Tax=Lapillicoccus sp. TaxID=1909287 RepID=UPI0032666B2E